MQDQLLALLQVLVFQFGLSFTHSIVMTYQTIRRKDIVQHQQWALRSYQYMLVIVLFSRGLGAILVLTKAVATEEVANVMVYLTSACMIPATEAVVYASCPHGYRFMGLPWAAAK
jgi:hypothetical protein